MDSVSIYVLRNPPHTFDGGMVAFGMIKAYPTWAIRHKGSDFFLQELLRFNSAGEPETELAQLRRIPTPGDKAKAIGVLNALLEFETGVTPEQSAA